jgi:hypothetical protein
VSADLVFTLCERPLESIILSISTRREALASHSSLASQQDEYRNGIYTNGIRTILVQAELPYFARLQFAMKEFGGFILGLKYLGECAGDRDSGVVRRLDKTLDLGPNVLVSLHANSEMS